MYRRPILLALALLTTPILAPFTAHAQNPGVIYYTGYSGITRTGEILAINGDGTGLSVVTADPAVMNIGVTSQSNYPGGRQFLRPRTVGTIPGTTTDYVDLMSWNPAGQILQLTAFNGPYYLNDYWSFVWSNDGLDTFCSFFLNDPATGLALLCRAHITPLDIADPLGFPPLAPVDLLPGGRIEVVAKWPSQVGAYAWNRDGNRIIYVDSRVTDRWRIRELTVVAGATPDDNPNDDPILFEQAGPYDVRPIGSPAVSPLDGRIVIKAQIYEQKGTGLTLKTDGYYTRDPVDGSWRWLINNQMSSLSAFSSPPSFSPDGTGLAFSAVGPVVSGKKTTTVPGIYKMPPSDTSLLRRLTGSSVGRTSGARWTW